MAEASKSRVTITLGRSGQVVKRAGLAVVDESSASYSQLSVGNKRSIRDRLGSDSDFVQLSNKRHQREDSRFNLSASSDTDDITLTKDDLRFKIMRKSSSQDIVQQKGDLRDLLSRPAHSSTTSIRQRLPELRDARSQFSEPIRGRHRSPDPRNNPSQLMASYRNSKQSVPEVSDSRRLMPDLNTSRNLGQGPKSSSSYGQILPSRSVKAVPEIDSIRRTYSPWTLDSLRRRSPDVVLGASRGLSPPRRRNEEQERRVLSRAYDDSRASSYLSKDALDRSHTMKHSLYMAKAPESAIPAKAMVPSVPSLPPSAGLVPKNSSTVDPYTVDAFLHSLGLEKYCINFKAEEVDMYALRQMGDSDLKELGIPMGPRKKILLTLMSQRMKRQL